MTPPTVTLTATEGPDTGFAIAFTRHELAVVGRAPDARYALADPYLSRYHFVVECNPPLCRLVNLSETNPTEVNGRPVTGAVDLAHGDEVRAGQCAFRAAGTDAARTAPGPLFLPGYAVEREAGRAPGGVVYKAVRAADNLTVSLRFVWPAAAPAEGEVAALLAGAAARPSHANAVQLVEAGESGGWLWFASEWVDGSDAGRLVRSRGPVAPATAVRVVLSLLEVLAHAHAKGAVHGGVGPGVVLLAKTAAGKASVRVSDFGLARAFAESRLAGPSGTDGDPPLFLPPEQFGDLTPTSAADLYAAGATLYYLLSGEGVYAPVGGVGDLLGKALAYDPVPLRDRKPEVPEGLAEAVHRALERDPAARWPDAAAFHKALKPFAS